MNEENSDKLSPEPLVEASHPDHSDIEDSNIEGSDAEGSNTASSEQENSDIENPDLKKKASNEKLTDSSVSTEVKVPSSRSAGSRSGKMSVLQKLFMLVFVLVVLIGFALATYFFLQEKTARQEQTIVLQSQLDQTQKKLSALESQQGNFAALANEAETNTKNRLLAAEQRLQAQHKRIMSLSSTTREDWLLAEAEYLLRLANQRVLIERSPKSADALLSEADEILRDLDDPDLFPLRQAITNDLVLLRQIEKIDHEGIYFSLMALAAQVDTLPLRPLREALFENDAGQVADEEASLGVPDESVQQSMWQRIKSGFASTFSFLDNYVRVRDHSQAPPPLLAPDSAVYLQQNLRLKIERAQLALLREQPAIYGSSLAEVKTWLTRYYPPSQQVSAFSAQVSALSEKQIVQQLPDITPSLELLHDYIETLHDLKGLKPSENSQAGEAAQ